MENKPTVGMACNITTGRLDSNQAVVGGKYPFFTCSESPVEIDSYAFDDDVVLVAGNNAQGNFHLNRYKGKFNAYQRTYVLTARNNFDINFIYYSLKLELKRLKEKSQGSQTKFLTKPLLENIHLRDIDKSEQLKISSILRAIDSKTEVNSKINVKLESMAKTIYNYWFVQFDFPDKNGKPYKSSGGKMVWNEALKRKIPEGWNVKEMNDLLTKNKDGYDFQTKMRDIDTLDLSIMPSATMCLNEKNSSKNFKTNLFQLKKYDILFGGIRPYLLKAGFAPFDGLVTGTVHSFKANNDNEYNFLILTMVHESMFNFAVKNSKGTKMPIIGVDDLLKYKVPYCNEIIEKFNELISFREIISHNILENQNLTELRDFLLPMLMNGQIQVADSPKVLSREAV